MDNVVLNAPDDEVMKLGVDPAALQDVKRVDAKQLKSMQNPSSAIGSRRLTDWPNEPTASELQKDLFAAKNSRDERVNKVAGWQLLLDGGKPITKRRGRSAVRPKLVRRQAEWRYSALSEPFLSSEDVFQVNPRTYEDGPAAAQNAILINWQFRTKMDLVRMIGEAVRTFVDEGTLILRAGWKRETEMETVEVPVYEYRQVFEGTQEEQLLIQALQIRDQNPAEFEQLDEAVQESIRYGEQNGVTAWAVAVGSQMVEQEKIICNYPTVDIVDYRNVYLDPSCGNDPDKAAFLIYSFETSKAELMRDKRYKNLRAVNYQGAELLTDTEHGTETPQDFQFDDEARKRVVAYEYWGMYDVDGSGKLQPIVATWIDNQLIRCELNPYPDKKHPFVFVQYSPIKKSVFGQPDAEMLSDNQAISGAVTRGMIDLLGRSANSQQGFQKGMLDVTNRRRFENGEDYEFNPAANPVQALIQHKYPEIPASAINLLNMQNNEAEALTGVKAFSGGLSGENFGKVAAGIKGVIDAAAKREMDILRRFAEGWKMIAVKIIAMNRVYLTDKEVVRVTNTKFVTVRRDDLEGQFDLKLDISTPEIDERKAQDLAFMLQTLGATMPFEFTQMILYRIAKLRKMPELAQQILEFQPQPDPVEQATKELEVTKLQLENAELQAKIAEIQAKTEKLQAEADQIDYETERDAAGITHAREMEKQSEQARGNQDLAITKGLVTSPKEGEAPFDLETVVGFNELTKQLSSASNQAVPVA
jgi:hypothetical protein